MWEIRVIGSSQNKKPSQAKPLVIDTVTGVQFAKLGLPGMKDGEMIHQPIHRCWCRPGNPDGHHPIPGEPMDTYTYVYVGLASLLHDVLNVTVKVRVSRKATSHCKIHEAIHA